MPCRTSFGSRCCNLVINRVLNVLFAEKERPVLESLPSELPEDSEICGLAHRREATCPSRNGSGAGGRQVCSHIDAPCSELPYYDGLEKDPAAIEALSEALLQIV